MNLPTPATMLRQHVGKRATLESSAAILSGTIMAVKDGQLLIKGQEMQPKEGGPPQKALPSHTHRWGLPPENTPARRRGGQLSFSWRSYLFGQVYYYKLTVST